ncbi:Uncharacterised protein [Mycobacteroides abscessus subsp. abscessus]|nr:Uncharacterised protein [Mycobacteroides abscessus subsp. abscessus]
MPADTCKNKIIGLCQLHGFGDCRAVKADNHHMGDTFCLRPPDHFFQIFLKLFGIQMYMRVE